MAKAWKKLELFTAEFFDAMLGTKGVAELEIRKKNPNWALNIPDYNNALVTVECKSKKQSFPKFILDAFKQLKAYPDSKGKIEMVMLHQNPKGDDYLVIKPEDLLKLVAIAKEITCVSPA